MANIITFSFKSDAPWSEDELDGLAETFATEVKGIDDDHIAGSFDISVVDENDHESDEKKKLEIINDFLSKAEFTSRVSVAFEGIGFETDLD